MSEHEHVSYSYGDTPEDVIKARSTEPYRMELVTSAEIEAVVRACNVGIDSHLEAITERSTYETFERTTKSGHVIAAGARFVIHPDELHVLLRRLWEDGSEEAWDLRSSILSTLEIEEI